jgi:Cu+-exporting ATPase
VGIAIGTGTYAAMESAGITPLKGDLMGIAGIPLAAGVLYPFFGLLLSPVAETVALALSSVRVIGNALRPRTAKVG